MWDFVQANKRHYEDGRLLEENSRIPNAGQLYGISAECGLKALLYVFAPSQYKKLIDERDKTYRQHIDKLCTQLITFAEGYSAKHIYSGIQKYLGCFDRWRMHHRYYNELHIPSEDFNRWREASRNIAFTVEKARMDGII